MQNSRYIKSKVLCLYRDFRRPTGELLLVEGCSFMELVENLIRICYDF